MTASKAGFGERGPSSKLAGRKFGRWRVSPSPVPFKRSYCLTYRGQIQVGSLTGAVHLSNDNAGVPRPAQRDQKSRVEHKGLCWLDLDFQYEYGR